MKVSEEDSCFKISLVLEDESEAGCLKIYVVSLVIMMKVSEEIKCLNTLDNKELWSSDTVCETVKRTGFEGNVLNSFFMIGFKKIGLYCWT